MLGSAQFGSTGSTPTIVIADLEAGIGTLTRLPPHSIDVIVVVVEPTPRSIDVAQRAASIARERGNGAVIIVANRVVDAADETRVADAFPGHPIVHVPFDQAIADADRAGRSPLDTAADSAGVIALMRVARLAVP